MGHQITLPQILRQDMQIAQVSQQYYQGDRYNEYINSSPESIACDNGNQDGEYSEHHSSQEVNLFHSKFQDDDEFPRGSLLLTPTLAKGFKEEEEE